MSAGYRKPIFVVLTLMAGSLMAYPWLQASRMGRPSDSGEQQYLVTATNDGGPGSLREVMFRALRAGGRITISIRPRRIEVAGSLPPLAGDMDLRIQPAGNELVRIDTLEGFPLFDIRADSVTFERLVIAGTSAEAMRVTGGGRLELVDVTIDGADVAVNALGEYTLDIRDSVLKPRINGISLSGTGNTAIAGSQVSGYSDAGIWLTQSGDGTTGRIEIVDSRFTGGRYGLMFANANARVEGSTIADYSLDGVIAYAGRLELHNNEISGGGRTGVRAVGPVSGNLLNNRVHDNGSAGVLLQSVQSVRVQDNEVYRNGLGIATVLTPRPAAARVINNLVFSQTGDGIVVLGDAPTLSGNRAVGNGGAGIKIYSVRDGLSNSAAAPLMTNNVFEGNGSNEPVLDEYRLSGAIR